MVPSSRVRVSQPRITPWICRLFFCFGLLWSTADAAPHGVTLYADPQRAPNFSLPDTAGKTHTLDHYRGKILIVNFWSTWCQPCRREMPSLLNASQTPRQHGIQILAISVSDTREEVVAFAKRYEVDFPLLLDTQASLVGPWSVTCLPSAYVVDCTGQIVLGIAGASDWEDAELLRQVQALGGNEK